MIKFTIIIISFELFIHLILEHIIIVTTMLLIQTTIFIFNYQMNLINLNYQQTILILFIKIIIILYLE